MPTVPSSFIPQVGMAGEGSFVPYQAPPVMPMDEATSKQQEELGRAMIAAGNTAYRLGSAMQDDIDDAATKEADTAAIGVMTKIRSDFMSKSGKDAESNYQSSVDQMSSAVNGIMDGLGNDTQKRMFQQVAARNMATFQSQMYDHRNAQTKQWASNEAAARADKYSDLAIISYGDRNKTDVAGRPMGLVNYQANLEIAVQEVRKAASLNGIPEGSEQMKMMEQKVYDKVATGVVNDLMNARQYGQAEAFLDDHPVDPKVDTTLRSSVDANRKRTTIEELTDNIMQRGVLAADSDPKAYPNKPSKTDTAPDTLREALAKADQIQDPDTRKLVQSNLRSRYEQQDALIAQEYRTLVDNTEQFLAVPGNTIAMLPAGQFGKLRPKDQQQFLKGERQDNELGTMEELARNPSLLSNEWLAANRTKMTHATYVKLLADVNQPQKVYEASVNATQLNATLANNGMLNLVDPKSDEDKTASLMLRDNIAKLVNAKQATMKTKMTDADMQVIIDKAIIQDKAFLPSWGRDAQKPIAAMTQEELQRGYVMIQKEEIPVIQVRMAKNALERAGIRNPTDVEVLEYWTRKGKPQ